MAASIINVVLGLSSKQFDSGLKKAEKSLRAASKQMQEVGRTMSMYVTAPILGAGAAAVKFASDYEESLNKVNVAFGSSSDEVQKFAKTTLNSFGIAEGSALDMAALFGDMSTSMGISQQEAAKLSTSLVGLAGDLASFKNMNIAEVTTALNGVFTGETESLKRLGVVMTQANLEQFAMQQGITKLYDEMSQGEKVMLRYQYVMSMTSNAHGDFQRTGGGAANQMRVFQEGLKELSVAFGQEILPAVTKIITKVNEFIKSFKGIDSESRKTIIGIGLFAAALGPVLIITAKVIGAIGALVGVIRTFQIASALASAKILLIVAAAVALAAAAVYVVKNWDAIAERFTNLFTLIDNWVIDSFSTLLESIKDLAAFLGIDILGDTIESLKGLKHATTESKTEFKSFGEIFSGMKNSITEGIGLTNQLTESTNNLTSANKENAGAIALTEEQMQALADTYIDALPVMQSVWSRQWTQTMYDGIERTKQKLTELIDSHKNFVAQLRQPAEVQVNILGTDKAINDVESFADRVASAVGQAQTDAIAGTAYILGSMAAMGAGLDSIAMNIGRFLLETLGNLMIQVGTAAIATGEAVEAIKAALTGLQGVGAIVAGIALVALGAGIKGYLASTAEKYESPTPFAQGGIVSGPTNALIGEYPNASTNPEIVAPLDKLTAIISKSLMSIGIGNNQNYAMQMPQMATIVQSTGGATQNIQVEVIGRIEGKDIYLANKRHNNTINRTT